MESELLPCPFCGDVAVMVRLGGEESTYRIIGCSNKMCGCELNFHKTQDSAIAAWNTRAALAVGGEEPNARVDERATLLVLANQYLALQKWVQGTVPEWTQEVQCCMDDCERTANRIVYYLDGKLKHLNPRREIAATRAGKKATDAK